MTLQTGAGPNHRGLPDSVADVVSATWAAVLRTERPGPDANFFAAGGNSLQGARLVSGLRDALGIRIPLNVIFENQTVAALAEAVEQLREEPAEAARTIEPLARSAGEPLQAPTSFVQQRMWVEEHIHGPSSRYSIPHAVELGGPLDVPALGAAVRALVARHEIFRTTIRAVDGVPQQTVSPDSPVDLELVDLGSEPAERREQVLMDRIAESARRPFDIERGPLLRFELYRLAEDWHVLLVNLHHAIVDIRSFELVVAELMSRYLGSAEEDPASAPVQYADYAAWQRGTVDEAAFDKQLDYWKEQLRGPLPALELPADLPQRDTAANRGASVSVELPRALSRRLRELSKRHDATPFMTLLALVNVLMHRYSGQTDVVIGTPSAGRDLPELETMLGCFLNTLAVRSDLSGDPTLAELLGRVRGTALAAYAHQDVPFERVLNAVSADRTSRQGLFRVMLSFHQEVPAPELPGLTVDDVPVALEAVKFDLVFAVTETEFTYRVALEYNTDLFVEDKAWRILEHLETLAADVVAAPDKRISELTILPEDERRRIEEWSCSAHGPYATDLFLHRLFAEQAARTPDSDAVESGDRVLSYRELDACAERLAARLAADGVGPDDLVGLCAEPSLELMVGILGILKAGAGYVPLDPLAPADRMAYVVADSGMRVLVTTPALRDQLPAQVTGPVVVRTADAATEGAPAEPADSGGAGRPGVEIGSEQLVYLMYTSGTTGNPKGVGLPHRAVTPWIQWAQDARPMAPGTRVLHNLYYHFDWSVEQMFHALTAGGCLVMLPAEVRADPAATARFIDDRAVTMLYLTPTQMRGIADAGIAMPTLRHVSMGGENLDAELVARTRALVSPTCAIWNEYGPTETAGAALVGRMGDEPPGRSSMPLGEPIANATCAVVDRWGNPQPIGVPGELWIGGDGVARGYHNLPGLTAERFAADPARPGHRLYRTGDLVRRLPDGELEFLGRVDGQVKIRGVRVELEEIESVLRGHADVANAVLVLDGDRLIAYVAPAGGGSVDEAALRAHAATKLPIVMQPGVYVQLASIPFSPTGKVDRRRLPKPEAAQSPEAAPAVPPSTAMEHTVARAWAEVLRQTGVSVHANFFEVGGDSFSLMSVVGALRAELGIDIPVRAVVDSPTIAGLASHLEALRWTLRSRESALDTSGDRETGEL